MKDVPLKETLLLISIFILQICSFNFNFKRYFEVILNIQKVNDNFKGIHEFVNFLKQNFLEFSINYHQSHYNQKMIPDDLSTPKINKPKIYTIKKVSEILSNKNIQSKLSSKLQDCTSKIENSRNDNIKFSQTEDVNLDKNKKNQSNLNSEKCNFKEHKINKILKDSICHNESSSQDLLMQENAPSFPYYFPSNNLNNNLIKPQIKDSPKHFKSVLMTRFFKL